MPDPPLPTRIAHLAREFLITVALAYICLLTILRGVQYHVHLFLGAGSSCERVALELAAVSPLTVLKITTACSALVFLTLEVCAHTGGSTARSPRMPDIEAGRADTILDVKSEVDPLAGLAS
ncbi:hypothetical protein FB451DRAFT_1173572 [Mycena latifolia]|nr:hypothetical protein FB451DRAFT_1173572 [Mycena latifolia]